MAEFSTSTRLIATLILVALSFVVWRWVLAPKSPSDSSTTATAKKQKKKKKPAKKKAKPASAQDDTTQAEADDANDRAASSAPASDSDEDTDEDAGLSAKQILAKRRFKPKAIGGSTATLATATTAVVRFEVDQRVVARYQDGRDWFPGVILELRRGGEYHIKYDDGAIEYHVPHARIKVAVAESEPRPSTRAKKPADAEPSRVATDSGRSEADDEATGSGGIDSDSASSDGSDDDGNDGDDSEDGWHVVSTTTKKTRKASSGVAATGEGEKVDAEGLTKRQRENRRKKERKKEVKEMVRAQAQVQGLHARWGGTMTRLKYVPPPTGN